MTIRCARSDVGFSLIELMFALAILTCTFALLFQLAASGQRLGRSQPDAADVQQRLRVAVAMLQRDLSRAGAGALHGTASVPLVNYFAPIVPARTGSRTPDPELTAYSDRISIVYVPDGGWHTRLSADMTGAAADVPIDTTAPGCPGSGLCGFSIGSRAVILEPSGLAAGYDLFTVTAITGGLGHASPFSRGYSAGALVMPVVHRVYYLDRTNRRLMLYDGNASDLPLVDNTVDLRFAYFADPVPASAPWPAGGQDNCVYAAGDPAMPLLAHLGGSAALRQLAPAQMADGPVCGVAPNRFDGDLLRIRRVRVTLRVEAAADHLRGSGAAFTNPGTSASGESYVPDFEVAFDVAPRNLHAIR